MIAEMDERQILRKIKKNRRRFEKMVQAAVDCKGEARQIQLCSQAAIFTSHHPSGVFNSVALEKCLVDISRRHSVPLRVTHQKNSYLHVLSRAYLTGGHTRVCERWIQLSPESETHSLALLCQGNRPVPELLRNVVTEKSGEVHDLSAGFPLEKALQLRELASRFEAIVLHTHPNDTVPTLAFAHSDFKRPVVFYNHADHLLWLGCSISDLVVNLRTYTGSKNKEWRGIENTAILPLPVSRPDPIKKDQNRSMEFKGKLGLPARSKVVVSIASSYKFMPFSGLDFIETAKRLVAMRSDVAFLIVGPHPSEKKWKQAALETKGKIKAVGIVPNSQLSEYLSVADLAWESFPLGSPTALLDVAKYKIPCLALDTPSNPYDAFERAGIVCKSTDELVERTLLLLEANHSGTNTNLFDILQGESFPEGFRQKLTELKSRFPVEHRVHDFTQDNRSEPSPFEVFVAYSLILNGRKLKNRLIRFIRIIIYIYIKFLFPVGMSKRIFQKLDQYSVV